MTREEFLNNQKEYCKKAPAPFFMPENGICYRCKKDIIPALMEKGEDGENHIITNCESSDARAVKEAVHEVERREGKMRGSIKVRFEDVLIKLR